VDVVADLLHSILQLVLLALQEGNVQVLPEDTGVRVRSEG